MTVEQARHYNLEQAFTWKLGIWQGGRLILGRGWLSLTRGDPLKVNPWPPRNRSFNSQSSPDSQRILLVL